MTRKDDNAAITIYPDSLGYWQAWVNVVDSWGIRMCYSLGVEAGSYEDAVSNLHAKIFALNKRKIKEAIKQGG